MKGHKCAVFCVVMHFCEGSTPKPLTKENVQVTRMINPALDESLDFTTNVRSSDVRYMNVKKSSNR